ncbi:MAG: lipoprotein [Ignavibacteria bacterium]|nr:MAG: lipoprotein [Ignavibacteria bacterium]KAF0160994.1 MAG: lipoprotein [Ignavibacteria bacterium]
MINVRSALTSIIVLTLVLFHSTLYTQSLYTQKDVDICNTKFKLAVDGKLAAKPINEIVVEIGRSFIGTDYAANTLEKGEKESVVINLEGLDCYTFVESTLALAICVKNRKTSFNDFLKQIENLRYRGGEMKDYPSRLHYFSDWIFDVAKRGIGEDVTQEIGGVLIKKRINFMSNNVDSYKRLKENPKFVEEVIKTEKEITKRDYYWIPQSKIASLENKIYSGDIIAITTSVEGLDIAHVGIAVRKQNGRVHFMHAPIVGKKIEITEKPLTDYIAGNKKQNGIMVFRVN